MRRDAAEPALARRLRRAVHRRPELAHREHRTAAYVERVLRLFGLRPFRPAPTSVAVVAGDPARRPRAGFRADLDALAVTETTTVPYASRVPGVMHACGHDGHTAALLLLARRLARAAPWGGSALLVFQQGEEAHPSGAPRVLRGLPPAVLPDEFYAVHLWPELPAGVIGVREGPLLASVAGLTFHVTGREGRAHGTRSESGGVNAVAAAVRLYTVLTSDPTGREVGAGQGLALGRIEGGEHPNRVPLRCELRGTLRALTFREQESAVRRIREVAAAVADETGAAVEVLVEAGIRPPVENAPEAARRALMACRATGTPHKRYPDGPLGVSDDFGWFLQDRPGALLLLGCGNGPQPPDLHTSAFDFDEEVLLSAVDVFDALARPGTANDDEVDDGDRRTRLDVPAHRGTRPQSGDRGLRRAAGSPG
ncbi:amidohydrolase [Spongiactinospora sp. TRM90649]|uniref:M20 metallopeptidase family protein n=1 Tax=Spongiactinospora sp. TRM90649 TaxID=3031114 RepID=UPI0023F79D0C|nr:amidohydrolase [Spongiactinospora sp. TRM90649]MDF5756214.1 amidohydrolase [Spongiactinospora sp. TRM90649]